MVKFQWFNWLFAWNHVRGEKITFVRWASLLTEGCREGSLAVL